ncbi:MFS transporter [Agromyces sp. MMS24-K17]|uniref:MFS transporter n=1 Tax=Agromyces sp. MMS24-K17 TaxID=3372850 RepID=UPI003753EF52
MTATTSPTAVVPVVPSGRGAPRPARAARLGHGAGFVVVALAFATAMAFSTVPTPLYLLYQQRDGLPTLAITLVFAAYAVGVAASLYLVGHVSDWVGRRRVVLIGLAVELAAGLLFLAWNDLAGLIVARFASGIGIGLITATATAHLAELRSVAPGRADPGAIAGLANIGGLALGPLIGGLLAQFVPAPLEVPYLAFVVLLAVAALAVSIVPETVEPAAERPAYRPQRVAVPRAGRATFAAAAAAAFAGFAVFGLFTSLTPSVLAGVLHESSRIVAGLVSAAVFASAAIAQLAAGRVRLRTQLVVALTLTLTGLGVLAWAVLAGSLAMFVNAAVVAGAGVGLLFRGALGVAGSLARPESRGEVLAGVFLVAYLGLALPVLAIGLALAALPLGATVVGFALVVAVLVAIAAPVLIRRAARPA